MANTKSQNITTVLATGITPGAKGSATFQCKIVCSGNLAPSLAQTVFALAEPED